MNGGVFHVLGPLGPLGALGPLGPLGPIGAHGFTRNSNGDWNKNGVVQRSVAVKFNTTFTRKFDLYESYDQKYAVAKKDNDCSFYVEATWNPGDTTSRHTYKFISKPEQFVSILLTPMAQLDDFDLNVQFPSSSAGKIQVISDAETYIDHTIVRVPPGTTITVSVELSASFHLLASVYRLYVTGSSEYFPNMDILGTHQVKYQ